MSKRRDYIGPTIKERKTVVLPEGPSAEFNVKASKGMMAARKLMGEEEPKVEGTMIEAPLQMGPPVAGIPSKKPEAEKRTPRPIGPPGVDPNVMLGNTHIGSLDTLLANDRMEKPRITAWQDEKEDDKKS